jgi:uncharacterized protein YbgA (DUF1722 family)/uncharacterized protein YbbK (DUF523 family)
MSKRGGIPVGISACLTGEEVRFDGGHKRSRFLTEVLGDYVNWVPMCPEVRAGLGVPRETFRLAKDFGDVPGVRMVGNRSDRDVTEVMQTTASRIVEELGRLRGFVLKKGSPSCGLERVRVYDHNKAPTQRGRGIFADTLARRYPLLPLEEEGRLEDPRIRENFITRIFTYDRWIRFVESKPSANGVVRFHTEHKMLLMAHHQQIAGELGRLVARAGEADLDRLLESYEAGLMKALARIASRGRHANALEHLAGFLKRDLESADRLEMSDIIRNYREGRLPLVVPLTLLYHHFRHLKDDWVDCQVYLQPYPSELALRSVI